MNKSIVIVIAALATQAAVAATVSPLDAAYYVGRPTAVVEQTAAAATSRHDNPLAADYYVGKPTAEFVGTAANVPARGYVESNNPLDAKYYWSAKK